MALLAQNAEPREMLKAKVSWVFGEGGVVVTAVPFFSAPLVYFTTDSYVFSSKEGPEWKAQQANVSVSVQRSMLSTSSYFWYIIFSTTSNGNFI